eukprot:scaffold207_cov409-Prasinococcus_capsulatus_cf.AAC.125
MSIRTHCDRSRSSLSNPGADRSYADQLTTQQHAPNNNHSHHQRTHPIQSSNSSSPDHLTSWKSPSPFASTMNIHDELHYDCGDEGQELPHSNTYPLYLDHRNRASPSRHYTRDEEVFRGRRGDDTVSRAQSFQPGPGYGTEHTTRAMNTIRYTDEQLTPLPHLPRNSIRRDEAQAIL